jgi:hypothetical protein
LGTAGGARGRCRVDAGAPVLGSPAEYRSGRLSRQGGSSSFPHDFRGFRP